MRSIKGELCMVRVGLFRGGYNCRWAVDTVFWEKVENAIKFRCGVFIFWGESVWGKGGISLLG